MFESLSPIEIALIKKIGGTGGGGGESSSGGSIFETSASGRIPDYDKGYAISALSFNLTSRAYI